jgi:hypothetical protein
MLLWLKNICNPTVVSLFTVYSDGNIHLQISIQMLLLLGSQCTYSTDLQLISVLASSTGGMTRETVFTGSSA